jgi:hypothetical protein
VTGPRYARASSISAVVGLALNNLQGFVLRTGMAKARPGQNGWLVEVAHHLALSLSQGEAPVRRSAQEEKCRYFSEAQRGLGGLGGLLPPPFYFFGLSFIPIPH